MVRNAPTLRALVVDDEALAAERMVRLCDHVDELEVVGVAGDGRTALTCLETLRPDLLLLDISMPKLDGLQFARTLAARVDPPCVIFVTAHAGHAVTAFELAATDYLLKPVSLPRLKKAVARVRTVRSPPGSAFLTDIWAPRGREMVRIATEALDYVSAERDYVRLHARGSNYLIRMALHELESRLDPDRFVRVHRSTLVALDRIRSFKVDAADGWTILLTSGQHVRVGRSFRPVVRRITAGAAQAQV